MKKCVICLTAVLLLLILTGCRKFQIDPGCPAPMLTVDGVNYFANNMPVNALPDGFVCMGELTEEEANDTGLQGHLYYADQNRESVDEIYVFQECGTPVGYLNIVDTTKIQWAYVSWATEELCAQRLAEAASQG